MTAASLLNLKDLISSDQPGKRLDSPALASWPTGREGGLKPSTRLRGTPVGRLGGLLG